MPTATYYDRHVERLFDVVERLAEALTTAGIEYRSLVDLPCICT